MKRLLFSICFLLAGLVSVANHITGGEMYYTLQSRSGNSYTYLITLKLYRDCNSTGAPLDPSAAISIFDNSNNSSAFAGIIPQKEIRVLNLGSPSPCIQNPPVVCYEVGFYEFTVTLEGNAAGYTVAYQRCCRITGINNLIGSSSVGSTYTADIPGTSLVPSGPENNSARFTGADTVIVCANNSFCYDFGAVDLDSPTKGDSLSYSFCDAYQGGTTSQPAPNPPAAPGYVPVPYNAPFRGLAPLGNKVNLDSRTGMLCGIAPAAGIYVVTVCVTEYRNGEPIAIQRKDLQIKIGDCNVADAALQPEYISCDGFSYTFSNEAPANPLVTSWYWEFGDGNASTDQRPTHTYADTGTYTIKLVVNRGQECSDSAFSRIKVYPGFFPGFTFTGFCANKPTQFLDTSKTRYGFIDTWRWEFGDATTQADSSRLQNPVYTYGQTGIKTVRFIVTSNKGCIDTLFKDITILDKPPLSVRFKDTLICRGDTMQLEGIGSGNFTWTPNTDIINPNTATPQVFPAVTTTYKVELNENGCLNFDSVRVRVVNFVTMAAMPDTTICLTDSFRLRAFGDALRFTWAPAGTLSDATIPNPMATPVDPLTTYSVTGRIGRCATTEDVIVRTVPYPFADAGPDVEICPEATTQLNATIVGSSFSWSPTASLSNPGILNPIASPTATTRYVLSVLDTQGCPKPKRDSVVVTVLPRVNAFAGRDTAVVVGQPLQLNASGGIGYEWSPPTSLSDAGVSDPIGLYNGSFDSIRYSVLITDENGCFDTAFLTVKVFKTAPEIFVPTAFTPNRDGRNDLFRPIAVGVSKIEYFRVFNRWGQLVFSTTVNGHGWDGRIGGKEQGTGTYVWVVKGVDYTGKVVFSKGTVTLIR